jgi:hypothetical protein
MTSAWWLLVAFVGGGCAGILVMALMRMAGGLPAQSDDYPAERFENDSIRIPDSKETLYTCSSCFDPEARNLVHSPRAVLEKA